MPVSTQQFLEIDQIREGVILLRNKAMRGVIMVSSLNFALKSDEEQNAIIYQFQNFLNSLDFSIEIVVQSRRLNITGYLDKLKELERKQENELLKTQTAGYQKFIRDLIGRGAIMSKSFFVAVPFTSMEVPGMKAVKKLISKRFNVDSLSTFAIIKFSDTAEKVIDFTASSYINNLNNALDSLTCGGYSALGDGLALAIKTIIAELRKIGAKPPRILLISDGKIMNTAADPLKMARLAQGLNVKIDTFLVGDI